MPLPHSLSTTIKLRRNIMYPSEQEKKSLSVLLA